MKRILLIIFVPIGTASATTIYFPEILPIQYFGLALLVICVGIMAWGFSSARKLERESDALQAQNPSTSHDVIYFHEKYFGGNDDVVRNPVFRGLF